MSTMTVRPVEGRMILMPERGFAEIAEDSVVPRNAFYELAVRQGDLVEVDDKGKEIAVDADDSEAAEKERADRAAVQEDARRGIYKKDKPTEVKQAPQKAPVAAKSDTSAT